MLEYALNMSLAALNAGLSAMPCGAFNAAARRLGTACFSVRPENTEHFLQPRQKYLLVAYQNSNVDVIFDNGKVINFPEIMNAPLTSTKDINDVAFSGDRAYLATNFGPVVINTKRHCRGNRNIRSRDQRSGSDIRQNLPDRTLRQAVSHAALTWLRLRVHTHASTCSPTAQKDLCPTSRGSKRQRALRRKRLSLESHIQPRQ